MRDFFPRGFVCFFIIFFALSATELLTVFATQATRDRLEQVERDRLEATRAARYFRSLLQDTHEEITRIIHEMQVFDERMMDALDALDDIEYSLLVTELRLEYAEMELHEARRERDKQFQIFQARLRAMQEHGPTGHLEMLLRSESFSDFLQRRENIRTIAQFDQEIINRFDEAEAAYLANLDELSRATALIQDLRFQQELALMNLQHLMDDRTEWLLNLSQNAAHQAFLIEIYELEQVILNDVIGELRVQYQREVDELERLRLERERAEQLARLNNFRGQFQWPIPTHPPGTRGFGIQMHPILRVYRMHTGIDVGAPTGTRIHAAAEGYVRFVGWMGGYGNTVIIDHGNGYSTLYAHNSRNRVREGQRVRAGQHIADVGSTGMSTGPHLHFEIRRDNIAIDPMTFFN